MSSLKPQMFKCLFTCFFSLGNMSPRIKGGGRGVERQGTAGAVLRKEREARYFSPQPSSEETQPGRPEVPVSIPITLKPCWETREHHQGWAGAAKGWKLSVIAAVPGSCEPLDMDAGNQSQVFQKSSKCSYPQSSLSSPICFYVQ